MFSKKSAAATRPATSNSMAGARGGSSTFSVLGSDVVIKGDIEAEADLHLDGKVEGDVVCKRLVQGDTGSIHGAVKAETARLAGRLRGSIETGELVILKTAQIEGDVHYDTLTIEQGARIDGRFAPKVGETSSPTAQPKPAQVQDRQKGGEQQLKVAQ